MLDGLIAILSKIADRIPTRDEGRKRRAFDLIKRIQEFLNRKK
jgi:hypothetical protein